MKRLIFAMFALFPAMALAGINSVNGLYLKGSLVAGFFDPPVNSSFVDSLFPISFFIQPTMGYRINNFFAIESSFDYLKNCHDEGGGSAPDLLGNNRKWGPSHYKLYACETATKIIYPFRSGISLYCKGGIAYVYQDVFNKIYENSPQPTIDSQTTHLLPLLGAGISHNFTQHFASDLAFTHIHGNEAIGSINVISMGLSYTF